MNLASSSLEQVLVTSMSPSATKLATFVELTREVVSLTILVVATTTTTTIATTMTFTLRPVIIIIVVVFVVVAATALAI